MSTRRSGSRIGSSRCFTESYKSPARRSKQGFLIWSEHAKSAGQTKLLIEALEDEQIEDVLVQTKKDYQDALAEQEKAKEAEDLEMQVPTG